MFTLETVLVHYWSRKWLSQEEIEQPAGERLGRVGMRLAIAFAAFALMIASLSWAGETRHSSPQLVAATRM